MLSNWYWLIPDVLLHSFRRLVRRYNQKIKHYSIGIIWTNGEAIGSYMAVHNVLSCCHHFLDRDPMLVYVCVCVFIIGRFTRYRKISWIIRLLVFFQLPGVPFNGHRLLSSSWHCLEPNMLWLVPHGSHTTKMLYSVRDLTNKAQKHWMYNTVIINDFRAIKWRRCGCGDQATLA